MEFLAVGRVYWRSRFDQPGDQARQRFTDALPEVEPQQLQHRHSLDRDDRLDQVDDLLDGLGVVAALLRAPFR